MPTCIIKINGYPCISNALQMEAIGYIAISIFLAHAYLEVLTVINKVLM